MYVNQMFEEEIKRKEALLKKYYFRTADGGADIETAELHSRVTEKTGFPRPQHFYRLMVEAINLPIEEAYFWMLDELRDGFSYNKSIKITDINAAAEHSSFFGVMEQRLGLQQDKAAQFLKGISEMLKALFQIVREIRIIDERLGYYKHTFNRKTAGIIGEKDEEAVGSEITLKGVWVDQVEGGVKNAASVYGLSQTVGFTVLPDLFFRIRADDRDMDKRAEKDFEATTTNIVNSVDATVEKLDGFNEKVKEVLKRKLTQYYMWKVRTYKELDTRRKFTIKYLRQHYDTIKLYMGWVKPYLRNISRLQMAEKLVRKDMADLIAAFEGALVEIEVLTYKDRGHGYKPVILVHMFYRSRPALSYVQEGYQRGPMHTGRFDMILRGYVWNDDQIRNYVNMREEEDLQMLGSIDSSIKDALDSLGEELKQYLMQAGENFPEEKKHADHANEIGGAFRGASEPFIGVIGGLQEVFSPLAEGVTSLTSGGGKKGHKKVDEIEEDLEYNERKKELKGAIYTAYKNYKKMHGMMTW